MGAGIPRKKGPALIRSDMLVVNKIELAEHVGLDLDQMRKALGSVNLQLSCEQKAEFEVVPLLQWITNCRLKYSLMDHHLH